MGFVAVPIIGLQGVSRWFQNHELGLAMGIYSTFMILAPVVTFSSFGNIASAIGWRATIGCTVIVTVVALIIFALFYRIPADNLEKAGRSQPVKFSVIFKMGWPIWILGLIWGLIAFALTSVIAFLPDFMYQQGFKLGIAGSITSLIMLVHVFFSPAAGYFLDRVRYKEMLLVLGALITGVAVFLLPAGMDSIILLVLVIGIGSTFFAPAAFAMTPLLVRYEMVALAFGIISTVNTLGAFGGPYVTGWIRDVSGSYQYSYWFQAFIFCLILVLSSVIWILAKRSPRA
jgi:cyanate permease